MKRILALSTIVSVFIQSCTAVKFKDYFPAIANKQSILLFTKDSIGTQIGYKDTLICRVKNAGTFRHAKNSSKGIAIMSPAADVQGGINPVNFFFFERPPHTLEDSIYVTDQSFAGLSYCFFEGRLYMSNVSSKEQRYWNEFFPVIFPKRIKMPATFFYKRGDMVQSFNFLGNENLEINGETYINCLKVVSKKNYNPRAGSDTIWFAKNIGLVKWRKGNGFIGVLQ